MTNRIATLVFCGAFLLAGKVNAEESPAPPQQIHHPFDLGRESSVDFRLNMGGTFKPGSFLLMGSAEYHLDRFFAVGPMLQLGFNGGEDYFIPTLGARLFIPIHSLKRFEASFYTGVGGFVWELRGITSQDFAYTAALNFDYFLMNELSVGMGTVFNVTSSEMERTRTSLFAGVSYRL